jgi:hypothetical protein
MAILKKSKTLVGDVSIEKKIINLPPSNKNKYTNPNNQIIHHPPVKERLAIDDDSIGKKIRSSFANKGVQGMNLKKGVVKKIRKEQASAMDLDENTYNMSPRAKLCFGFVVVIMVLSIFVGVIEQVQRDASQNIVVRPGSKNSQQEKFEESSKTNYEDMDYD